MRFHPIIDISHFRQTIDNYQIQNDVNKPKEDRP